MKFKALQQFSKEKYVEMKVIKKSDEEVAEQLGVCTLTLQAWKTSVGVTRKDVNMKRFEMINSMLGSGKKMYQIARYFNLTIEQCFRIKKMFH